MKIILASKSPRRKELLKLIVNDFKVIVSNVDENIEDELEIEEKAKKIAFKKAKVVFDETKGNRIVIGSDTMVVKNKKIYGKPKNNEDAFNMIKDLKNAKHQVVTGIAILVEKDGKYTEYLDYDIANVYLKDITDDEIENWIETGEAKDKAGAYAIQSKFMIHIEKIDGNYATIVGLPINKIYDILKKYIKIF